MEKDKHVWKCTDNDCCQQQKALNDEGTLFEMYQVCELPERCGGFAVAKGIIDLDCYDDDSILDVLKCYGYDGMEDFEGLYPASQSFIQETGIQDLEAATRFVHRGLIAEMLFEQEALDLLLEERYSRYEDAEKFILDSINIH